MKKILIFAFAVLPFVNVEKVSAQTDLQGCIWQCLTEFENCNSSADLSFQSCIQTARDWYIWCKNGWFEGGQGNVCDYNYQNLVQICWYFRQDNEIRCYQEYNECLVQRCG